MLGRFLAALHRPAPHDAPTNEFRGGPLADRRTSFEERARRLAELHLLPDAIERIWADALDAPIDVEPTWLHGDLHPLNVLSHAGRLSAVIDWIDICAGDPATDLACLWTLPLAADARGAALSAYGRVSQQTLVRARGWAGYFGVMHYASGLTNAPRHARIGERILRDLANDAG
jgi:aminoglycoside phosphotransferase (APT) family kinase protein